MTSSVLVTGSSGMIGTALLESLLNDGYDAWGVDIRPNRWRKNVDNRTTNLDLTSSEIPESGVENTDTIIHAAANARVFKLVEQPKLAYDNLEMTFNILELAREYNIPNIIFLSSREVYGENYPYVCSEDNVQLRDCESPYTASKLGSEALLNSYTNCYGINKSILRLSNVYGRYDTTDRVVPLFIAKAIEDEDLTIYGEEKLLDFTYIDDAIRGIRACLDQFEKAMGMTFNIASGRGHTINELADKIIAETKSDSRVTIERSRAGEINKFVADISKAKQILGYSPNYSFERGIENTVKWYIQQEDLLREIRKNHE